MSTTLGADFRTPTFWQRLAFIIAITLAGTFLYSVGVNAFLVPHQFLSGGLTGIAMVLYYLTGFPIGMANLLMNIPILLLSLKFMGNSTPSSPSWAPCAAPYSSTSPPSWRTTTW